MSNDYRDRFLGCIVGGAVGDALGMPCEGYSMNGILEKFGRIADYINPPKGHFNYGKLKAGMYTDDTEQTLILAESIKIDGPDINLFAKNLFEYGKNVIKNPKLDRWIGGTFKKAVRNYMSGKPITKCGVASESCGSAMRVAPIGLSFDWTTEIRNRAAKSSKVTHLGSQVTDAAEAVASYVNLSIKKNQNLEQMSRSVLGLIGKGIIENKLKEAYELRKKEPEHVIEILGKDYLARDVVSTALYAFHHSPQDFENAVLTAVNMGSDTDSRATITGAISGAYNGLSSIPTRWISRLENKYKLMEVATRIYNLNPL